MMQVQKLSQWPDGEVADAFVLFTAREQMLTRDKKPYWRVTFRDDTREVSFPIWENSPLAIDCREIWIPGKYYKIRAMLRQTKFGPNLEIQRIREATEADIPDGFDPQMGLVKSSFDPVEMYAEILQVLREAISDSGLFRLVEYLFEKHREAILTASAAQGKHHATAGGFLEHTRNVLRTALWLAERYTAIVPMNPPLNRGVVAAAAALHDIGKLRELRQTPAGFEYTSEGMLLGHIVMGRDYVRDAARELREKEPEFHLDEETQLRLEHAILSHQRLPEWGSPKPNMTPESLLVHYADDIDAKYYIMAKVLEEASPDVEYTDQRNLLHQTVFRGLKTS